MWDIREITKTVSITSGEDTAEVVIRKLSEGDKQDILDAMNGEYHVGTLRRMVLESAVVSWTVPIPLSPEALRNLPAEVGGALYDEIEAYNDGIDPEEVPPT